jgi:hypothetical protein
LVKKEYLNDYAQFITTGWFWEKYIAVEIPKISIKLLPE